MKVISTAKQFDDQPEDRVITISRIKDASCPYRYFKGYIERPKDQKAFVSIEAGIGQFFHSYVENRFRLVIARDGTINRDDILDVVDLVRSFRLSFLWEQRLRAPYKIVRSTYSLGDFILRLELVSKNVTTQVSRIVVS